MGSQVDVRNIKTIFFDYDGTIHNSIKIYAPAFRKAYNNLVRLKYVKPKEWSEKEISKWIGLNPEEMWAKFMPQLSKDVRNASSQIITDEMNKLIKLGYPTLYNNSEDVMKYLSKNGYILVLLSNCKKKYIGLHTQLFNLKSYFKKIICSEEYMYKSKKEILTSIKGEYPERAAFIGDRKTDIEAGRANDMLTIGCTYGFGVKEEVNKADILIDDISDLLDIF